MVYALHCNKYGLLLYAMQCLSVLYAVKMGVAAIGYDICFGFCYMLHVCTIKWPLLYAIRNPLGPYLLYVYYTCI